MKPGDPISVVIITWRTDLLVERCVDSVLAQGLKAAEIRVVVSNGFKTLLLPNPVQVLQLGKNVGFARAANAGAQGILGDLLLLNDDVTLEPGCLEALDSARKPGVVLQPRLILPDGSLDNVGHGFFLDGAVWARGRGGPDIEISGSPGGFSGAAVLFPKALWEELGGFDARFESFGEDVDLSLRLMRKGVRVQVAGRAIHLLGASYGRGGVEKVRRIERNRVRAAIRSLPVSALMLMPLVTAGRYGLAAGLKAVGKGPGAHVEKGAGKAALTGLMEGILDIPEWWEARKSDSVGWTRAEWAMWQALMEGRVRLQDLLR